VIVVMLGVRPDVLLAGLCTGVTLKLRSRPEKDQREPPGFHAEGFVG
jgi:hypothetical protein